MKKGPFPVSTFPYIGLFFFVMSIIVFLRDIAYYDIYNFIWFCDIGLLLFSIAFFTRNIQFIKGLINIGLIAQFIFVLEIVLYILFHISFSTLPVDLLSTGFINTIMSIIIHLASTNLALILTYMKKTKVTSLYYSIGVICLLFILSVFFTPSYDNINYIFSPNFLLCLSLPFYTFLWPVLVFLIPVLPTYWLQRQL